LTSENGKFVLTLGHETKRYLFESDSLTEGWVFVSEKDETSTHYVG
jgi:hypothetical protein